MMKVLVLTYDSDRPERAIFKGLVDRGHSVEILCGPSDKERADLVVLGLNASPFVVRHRFDIAAVRRLRAQLEKGRFDLIYAPRNKTLSCALMAARTLPDLKVVGYRGTIGHISRFDPASWMAYLNPRLDLTLCVSDAVKDYLLTFGIPDQRLVRIYKGHDPEWYQSADRSVLRTFGIPDGAITLGFVGNMRPVKGVDTLLKAAALMDASSGVHFLLVGEVRDKGLLALAENPLIKSRVHWTGFRSDAASLMGCCDMFAMPSVEREGLPRAVIEAMAQGVTPVVTRVGGLPELVENGVSGLVVPPRDAVALAEAFTALAGSPVLRMTLGHAARRRIHDQFNIKTTCSAVQNAFQTLMVAAK
jgi:glycosyltransferase involved in cell wall biosynthesis